MKQILFIILSALIFSNIPTLVFAQNSTEGSDNILVVYFSKTGNTKAIAQKIQEKVGGDIFEIDVVTPYPDNRDVLLEQAKKEQGENNKPELKTKVEDISKYNIIFLGHPIWWSQLPPPVTTFLTEYDLANKTIVPYSSSGSGNNGQTVEDITKLAPNSKILEALPLRTDGGDALDATISTWLNTNNIKEK
jgi:flavodoxin